MTDTERKHRGEVLEQEHEDTEQPALFRVVLHNDDYTTMEFVVEVLESIFGKSPAEAYGVMMHVHQRGAGVAGLYPYEEAERKVALVHEQARAAGYPLRATVEEE
jgi:ATP-dependent Clp protease adaptor protein ClpS